ncbi:MAG: ATP-binding protein [Haloferacaceae archaeon]
MSERTERAQEAGADRGRRADRPMTLTSRLVEGVIRRLLRYRPSVPGRPPAVLGAVGAALAVLSVAQLAIDPEPLGASLVESLIPLLGAGPVVAAARWTTRIDRSAEKAASAVIVSVVFMAVALATVGLVLLTQLPAAASGFDYPFAVVAALTAGALVGTPSGFVFDEVIARQEELEAEYREVARLNQRLQVINRVMRHNVRNELTVALGAIAGLREAEGEAESGDGSERGSGGGDAPAAAGTDADAWLERSAAALERLREHTEKLLELESLERSTDDRTTVDLAAYVEEYLGANAPDGVRITADLAGSVPVRAHPLVGTAVVEVIENALVHNDHDDLAVAVRIAPDGDEVEVEVADTGEGIPETERAALDRGAETPLVHAQGVGLWLVRWVCDVSGGRLEIEENSPSGTVVRLRLPRA